MDTLTGDVLEGTLAIDGVTEGINDTTEETFTDGNVDDSTGTLDNITLLDQSVVTEHDDTDIVGFQVEGHTLEARRELNHLFGLDVSQTVDTSNTITDRQHTAGFFDLDVVRGVEDTLFQDRGDLGSGYKEISGAYKLFPNRHTRLGSESRRGGVELTQLEGETKCEQAWKYRSAAGEAWRKQL